MESTNEQNREKDILYKVIRKAWEDESFKQELLVNPIDAIEKATGERVSIPEGKKFVVRDQTDPATIFINIPVEPNMDDLELNEAQLEAVAGGSPLLPLIIQLPNIPIPKDPSLDGYQ